MAMKEDKNDFKVTIECSDNEGYIVQVMDMDEPMEDKKYTFTSIDETLKKVKSLFDDEEKEEAKEKPDEDDVPSTKEAVKVSLKVKNMGSTAKEMKAKGY